MACHQERRSAAFLSSRNATVHLLRKIKTPLHPRRGKTTVKSTTLDYLCPNQGRNGGVPPLDETAMINRLEIINPLLRPPRIVKTTSHVACYQGKLQRPNSLSAWRSHLRLEPTMERRTLTSILRTLTLSSIIEESEGPSNIDCSQPLSGRAMSWYKSLPEKSITSWKHLRRIFSRHFTSSCRHPKSEDL